MGAAVVKFEDREQARRTLVRKRCGVNENNMLSDFGCRFWVSIETVEGRVIYLDC